ncbi:UNVERIFIED_CONTAM: cell division transport system permease protein [Acetivibrio alkalicellulosi]
MKLRTAKYIVKEGFVNTYRNILMSFASIVVVGASLLVFGVFWAIMANINYNTRIFTEQPEMEVFCNPELDDAQITTIEWLIMSDDRISEYTIISKEEALERAKEMLGDDKSVLEGFEGEDILPVSFIIKLDNPGNSKDVVDKLSVFPGVDNVRYSQETIDLISKLVRWIRAGSGMLILMLLVISIVIIANTIKLTVFSRRKEINIMKFIGATDWFIRLPFIVEGVIIGLVGALISFGVINLIYTEVSGRIINSVYFLKVLEGKEIYSDLILSISLIGVLVGALGSTVSIRKHLRV